MGKLLQKKMFKKTPGMGGEKEPEKQAQKHWSTCSKGNSLVGPCLWTCFERHSFSMWSEHSFLDTGHTAWNVCVLGEVPVGFSPEDIVISEQNTTLLIAVWVPTRVGMGISGWWLCPGTWLRSSTLLRFLVGRRGPGQPRVLGWLPKGRQRSRGLWLSVF